MKARRGALSVAYGPRPADAGSDLGAIRVDRGVARGDAVRRPGAVQSLGAGQAASSQVPDRSIEAGRRRALAVPAAHLGQAAGCDAAERVAPSRRLAHGFPAAIRVRRHDHAGLAGARSTAVLAGLVACTFERRARPIRGATVAAAALVVRLIGLTIRRNDARTTAGLRTVFPTGDGAGAPSSPAALPASVGPVHSVVFIGRDWTRPIKIRATLNNH